MTFLVFRNGLTNQPELICNLTYQRITEKVPIPQTTLMPLRNLSIINITQYCAVLKEGNK